MNFVISVHKLFWLDYAKAREYYESVSVHVADQFDNAFDNAYNSLLKNPHAYFNLSRQIRRIQLSNFPYRIIYSFKKGTIYILCLQHSRSNKKEWHKRNK